MLRVYQTSYPPPRSVLTPLNAPNLPTHVTVTSPRAVCLNQPSPPALVQHIGVCQGHKPAFVLACLTSRSCHQAGLALRQAWLGLQHSPQVPTLHQGRPSQQDILHCFAAVSERPSREAGSVWSWRRRQGSSSHLPLLAHVC